MSEQKNRVTVNIYGRDYVVRGEDSAEYIQRLAARLDDIMKQVGDRTALETSQVAVLTALNLVDELEKAKAKHAELLEMVQEGRN